LSRFPGPKSWAAFRLRYCYSLWRGDLVLDIHNIHTRYGDFVRVAPNEISVANSDGWNDIYCRRPGHLAFPKNPIWWGELPGRAPSIVSAPKAKDHQRMRKLLEHCFTAAALSAQEPIVQSHVALLIERLKQRCLAHQDRTTMVDIVKWMSYVIFDITGDLGFAESFHCLDNDALHPWVAELFSYGKVGSLVAAMRHYTVLFQVFMRCIPKKVLEASRAHYRWAVQKTHRRLNREVQREDWMKYILQYSDAESEQFLTIPELESNMNVMIFAGSDTCATVLSGTVNHLIKTPRALEKLVVEVRSAFDSPTDMRFTNLKRLPYLEAVVQEGLRMCPPNPSGLQHIVPAGGDTVMGHWLPAGVGLARPPHPGPADKIRRT
jgi:cytochrome P450